MLRIDHGVGVVESRVMYVSTYSTVIHRDLANTYIPPFDEQGLRPIRIRVSKSTSQFYWFLTGSYIQIRQMVVGIRQMLYSYFTDLYKKGRPLFIDGFPSNPNSALTRTVEYGWYTHQLQRRSF